MKISLIGMSGAGKTHWSVKLEEEGFKRFYCDGLINKKIAKDIHMLEHPGMHAISHWLGQPYDPRYQVTSNKYINFEKQVMMEVLKKVQQTDESEDIVVDASGSVIYTPNDILDRLSKHTKIIYLEAPPSVKDEMYQLYFRDPKPIIWGDQFKKTKDETNEEALSRCYPLLMESRARRYEKLANVTLDYHDLRRPDFTIDDFLAAI